jgi:hypothetical protein
MTISPAIDLYMNEMVRFGADEPAIAKEVVLAGAQPIADGIRNNLKNLPVDNFKRLQDDEMFNGLSKEQKEDLLDNLGIAPPIVDTYGNTNTKVGFQGYGRYPTKKYPKGIPNALLARSAESGSSVRKKMPFVRPAVNKYKKVAIKKMQDKICEKLKNYSI